MMKQKRLKHVILSPGQVVKELRKNKGWTLALLSEITGIAVSNLSNLESGRSRLGEDRAILLAEALGVKPEFLLFPNGFEREDLKLKLKQIQNRIKKLVGDVAA
jgi:transcriptional regulator with XRE-family HTH domain